MEIIKSNPVSETKNPFPIVVKCTNCKSVVSVTEDDLEPKWEGSWPVYVPLRAMDGTYCLRCPVCNKQGLHVDPNPGEDEYSFLHTLFICIVIFLAVLCVGVIVWYAI